MTDSVNAVLARIDEIKERFGAGPVAASGTVAGAAPAAGGVKPYFPQVLAEALGPTPQSSGGGPVRFEELLNDAAARYGLPPAILKGVVKAESGFRPDAVSPAGAVGLMQLMPSTARALGVADPLDPASNIDGGARYLKQQVDRFGDISQALAAYNAGPGAVARHGGVPPYTETQNYVRKVLEYSRDYGLEQ
jgi:soluble lytic murein transglycosylase-like protein